MGRGMLWLWHRGRKTWHQLELWMLPRAKWATLTFLLICRFQLKPYQSLPPWFLRCSCRPRRARLSNCGPRGPLPSSDTPDSTDQDRYRPKLPSWLWVCARSPGSPSAFLSMYLAFGLLLFARPGQEVQVWRVPECVCIRAHMWVAIEG